MSTFYHHVITRRHENPRLYTTAWHLWQNLAQIRSRIREKIQASDTDSTREPYIHMADYIGALQGFVAQFIRREKGDV